MNIAFVNATRRWGGVKSWTLRVGGALVDRGHRVAIVLRSGTEYARAARERGLRVHEIHFGPDWNPLAIRRLGRILDEETTDVLVTNVSKDNRIGGPAARRRGIPVLQRVGGPGDIRDRGRVRLEHERYVTHIVTPAAFIREHLARHPWMHAEDRVTVVPNGVDLDRFAPGAGSGLLRKELGLDAATPLIVTTSQLTAIKGHRHLIAVLGRLRAGSPPTLAFVGEGAEEGNLRRLAAETGAEGRVRFLGFREDLHLLLEDADLFCQPSIQEGFPNSIVEAMAKGKPIVASNLAGVPEAIEDGRDGLLVAPGDEPALADALNRLLGDPELARTLGAAARLKAELHFSETLMVDRVETVLVRLDGAAGGAPKP